jgi:hypothetical protein
MKRNTHVFVPEQDFTLLSGEDNLGCYQVRSPPGHHGGASGTAVGCKHTLTNVRASQGTQEGCGREAGRRVPCVQQGVCSGSVWGRGRSTNVSVLSGTAGVPALHAAGVVGQLQQLVAFLAGCVRRHQHEVALSATVVSNGPLEGSGS